jgi:bifunctional ADP-heptose synthase (sugar kinase/adenylyltransferase)
MHNTILVIGDLIIDETYKVTVNRISPEAPIPTAELLGVEPFRTPGGAGFAAAWSVAQGNPTYLCTAVTSDNKALLWFGHGITVVESSPDIERNVTKTRFIDEVSGYHLLRLDNDRIASQPATSPSKVIDIAANLIKGDGVVGCLLSDYKKGFFHPSYRWSELIDFLGSQGVPTLLDTRMENIDHFMGAEKMLSDKVWLKLNEHEADRVCLNLLGKDSQHSDLENFVPNFIVTRGPTGAILYAQGNVIPVRPDIQPQGGAPDTTGCGDIFNVSYIEGLANGMAELDALQAAVNTASTYAWIPFEEKLCSPQTKD